MPSYYDQIQVLIISVLLVATIIKLASQLCPLAVLLTDQSSLRTKAEKGQIPHYLFSVT